MNIQTIVYDEDCNYVRSIIGDLSNTSAIVACCSGDAMAERDNLKQEVEQLTRKCQNADLALKAQTQNCDTLRAQLAERDSFIHDLEANCDPAGTVRENTLLRDQTKQLNAMIGRLKSELAEAHALLHEVVSTPIKDHIRRKVETHLSASAEPSKKEGP